MQKKKRNKLVTESSTCIKFDLQRATDSEIVVMKGTWNGLGKVGAKSSGSSNAQRDFRSLSREDVC